MTVFTPTEEVGLTIFNACAFDLARIEALAKKEPIPTWLCSSDECRADYRAALCRKLRGSYVQFRGATDAEIEEELNARTTLAPVVEKWKRAELKYKEYREAGNPRAFFVDDNGVYGGLKRGGPPCNGCAE